MSYHPFQFKRVELPADGRLNVLVFTNPYPDGLGDYYSAYRLKNLIQEEHPEWNVKLYIYDYFDYGRSSKPDDVATKLSDIKKGDLFRFAPHVIVSVAGRGYHHATSNLFANDHEKALGLLPNTFAESHHPLVVNVTEYGFPAFDPGNYDQLRDMYTSVVSGSLTADGATPGFMRLPRSEADELVSKSDLGTILPSPMKEQIQSGNYFFSYGREHGNKLYIEGLLETPDRAKLIYVVAPGDREINLDDKYNYSAVDYNTGKVIRHHDSPDVVLIRGRLDSPTFKSLLKETTSEHVLVTGDMSLTEALSFDKLPFYETYSIRNVEGDCKSRLLSGLYGSYEQSFKIFGESKDDIAATMGNPSLLEAAKTFVLQQYHQNLGLSGAVCSAILSHPLTRVSLDEDRDRRDILEEYRSGVNRLQLFLAETPDAKRAAEKEKQARERELREQHKDTYDGFPHELTKSELDSLYRIQTDNGIVGILESAVPQLVIKGALPEGAAVTHDPIDRSKVLVNKTLYSILKPQSPSPS